MNWLAHVLLSESDIEFRLGNLLADLVKGRDRAALPTGFHAGVQRHLAIDAFTDAHPVVHRSRARVRGGFRHATGILVDVFYDHFLALDWDRYTPEPLEVFTARLYADIRRHPIALPDEAREAIGWMIVNDRLGSYRTLDGIADCLQQVSLRLEARTGRDLGLECGVSELVANFDGLRADFAEFFPLLRAHVGVRAGAETRTALDHGPGSVPE